MCQETRRTRRWIGLDVGGANLKGANTSGEAWSRAFPLWKERSQLWLAVSELLKQAGPFDAIALTMTGELADCYRDRSCGVRDIITQVIKAAASRPVWVYTVGGRFLPSEDILRNPDQAAAANWLALAQLAARWISMMVPAQSSEGSPEPRGHGVLIDVGSTTTDVIPIRDGKVATTARTDFDRLLTGELLYFGVGRTPICSLVPSILYRNAEVPLMAEVFATTDDVSLILGYTAEDANDRNTADGRPRTRAAARNRLARMIGLDHRTFDRQDAEIAARQIWQRLRERLRRSLDRVEQMSNGVEPFTAVLSGHGAILAEPLPHRWRVIRAADRLGAQVSRAAPAYAVAVLAESGKNSAQVETL